MPDQGPLCRPKISALPGFELGVSGNFSEFVNLCPISAEELNTRLAENGILGGLPLKGNQILWCCTEMNTKEEIDLLISILGRWRRKLLFEHSKSQITQVLPCTFLSEVAPSGRAGTKASTPVPQMSESEVACHYTALAQVFGVGSGFYPLGSCTMKYNPKLNEQVAALPGFTGIHPFSRRKRCRAVWRFWLWRNGIFARSPHGRHELSAGGGPTENTQGCC